MFYRAALVVGAVSSALMVALATAGGGKSYKVEQPQFVTWPAPEPAQPEGGQNNLPNWAINGDLLFYRDPFGGRK